MPGKVGLGGLMSSFPRTLLSHAQTGATYPYALQFVEPSNVQNIHTNMATLTKSKFYCYEVSAANLAVSLVIITL